MDAEKFKKYSAEMTDFIIDYYDTIADKPVVPDVEPGCLHKLIPFEAPKKPEPWEDIMSDIKKKIMPGMVHWQHPRFHAYFSSGCSYSSVLADMLVDSLGIQAFSWVTSPAATELETIVTDWMGRMMGLPEEFLYSGEGSKGGGVLQSCASEAIFVSCMAARTDVMNRLKTEFPIEEESKLRSKLVAYASRGAHSSAEKAAHMSFVQLHLIDTDDNQSVRGSTFRKVIEEDIDHGLIPFWMEGTLGTTSTVAFDNILEIGPICEEFKIWLHIDAAYAGSSFVCPELRGPMRGIEFADSINFNPYKKMLIPGDGSFFWVKDRYQLNQSFGINPVYLQNNFSAAIDYRHWGISISHRFRALKIWATVRTYGVEGIQNYIREHCRLGEYFASLVREDKDYEIIVPVSLDVVSLRLKGSNSLNRALLGKINSCRELHLTPSEIIIQGKSVYLIRFAITHKRTTEEDVRTSWDIIRKFGNDLLYSYQGDDGINIKRLKMDNEIGHDNSSSDVFMNKCLDPTMYDMQTGKQLPNVVSQGRATVIKNQKFFNHQIDIHALRNLLSNDELKEGGTIKVIAKSKNEDGEIYYSFTKKD